MIMVPSVWETRKSVGDAGTHRTAVHGELEIEPLVRIVVSEFDVYQIVLFASLACSGVRSGKLWDLRKQYLFITWESIEGIYLAI